MRNRLPITNWITRLLVLGALICAVPAVSAEDPATIFLRGYTEFQTGERLESNGDYEKALAKYRFAASLLEQLVREDPSWQPLVVQYRLRKIVEAIGRVEDLAPSLPAGLAGDAAATDFPEGALPLADPVARPELPMPFDPQPPRTVPQPPATSRQTPPGSSRQVEAELAKLRSENQQLREQLTQRIAEVKSARHEVDKTRVNVVELRHELAQAKTRLEDALKDVGSVTQIREEFAKQLLEISDEFEKTRAEREVLAEENERLLSKLEQAAEYITTSDEIRQTLEEERKSFAEQRNDARADRDKIQAELETTLTELETSRDRLSRLEVLAGESTALKEELASQTVRVTELEEQLAAAGDTKELEQLNEDLARRLAEREETRRLMEEESQKLTAELEEARKSVEELALLQTEKDRLEGQLAEARSESTKLAGRVEELEKEPESSEDTSALAKELEEVKTRLAEAETTKRELEEKVTVAQAASEGDEELTKQLEQARAEVAKLEKVQEENVGLAAKLEEAEKQLAAAPDEQVDQGEVIFNLQSELNTVSDRLFALRSELAARDNRIEVLEKQLDETAGELASLRLSPTESAADAQAAVENELLRQILLRELNEQARRAQARRLIEEEIERLEIQSETISENLNLLGKGIELTEEERSLFRFPIALVEERSPDSLEASITITKPRDESTPPTEEATPTPTPPANFEALTPAQQEVARKAQRLFDEGNFGESEDLFFELTRDAGENYFVLSRLAATQFQSGKTRAAEIALQRALELNPDDSFSLSIQGVVFLRQNRLDEAEKALRRSLEIEPGQARTHNYLGILLSQKGDNEQAEEELQKAIQLEPKYADAHFNLAVIYATQEPPSKELARKHYFSATSLGAQPDITMERLLQ